MSCTSPLKGVILGRDVVTGKKIVKVLSRHDESYQGYETFPVPCGNCMACRLEYSRQWANRCMMEAMYHDSCCFITLTYDDLHIPRRRYRVSGSQRFSVAYSLSQADLQKFFKRLRKRFPAACIRYFGCGEYGPTTLRPHYHVILFGIDFPDRVEVRKSKSGQKMYTSEILTRLWSAPPRLLEEYDSPDKIFHESTPIGMATVQDCTWETCAYTARYVTKKLKGPYADFYKERNIDPPFTCMSRRPGIGRQYYEDHPDLWDHDYIHVPTSDGGKQFRPPKYFMKLYEQDSPYLAEAMKEVRKALALEAQLVKDQQVEYDPEEYLEVQANSLDSKIKSLQRSGC